jgi:uncharacterized protein YecE (DUF72 family)
MKLNSGCSGFHYKHWRGNFYPDDLPEKKWFEYYCQFFNSLELNVTFYRFPQLSTLQSWHSRCPDDFRFAVKAPRIITHYKKFSDTASLIEDFYHTVDSGLKQKLGCILFQLPPNFHFSEAHLDRIVNSLNPSFKNVVEFRHQEWWRPEVFEKLRQNDISFCGMSHPDFPDDIVHTSPLLYYRMHGRSQLYASNYSQDELNELATQLKRQKKLQEAYIFFNNDINGYAPVNAQYLSDKWNDTQHKPRIYSL